MISVHVDILHKVLKYRMYCYFLTIVCDKIQCTSCKVAKIGNSRNYFTDEKIKSVSIDLPLSSDCPSVEQLQTKAER